LWTASHASLNLTERYLKTSITERDREKRTETHNSDYKHTHLVQCMLELLLLITKEERINKDREMTLFA
jgi:hypothetical protein